MAAVSVAISVEEFERRIAALSAECTERVERVERVAVLKALRQLVFGDLNARGMTTMCNNARWAALQAACAAVQHKSCGSELCQNGVLPRVQFAAENTKKDKLHSVCKDCSTREAAKRRKRHRDAQTVTVAKVIAEADPVRDNVSVENRFAAWLKAKFPELVEIMPEFRRCDTIFLDEHGQRIRVQLKASEQSGRTAAFANCFGYGTGEDAAANAAHRMVMVCGHRRRPSPDGGDAGDYTVWVLDGASVPLTSSNMNASTKTCVLCPASLALEPLASIDELPAAIRRVAASATGGGMCTTYRDAFFDVVHENQRKEMTLMLALERVGYAVTFAPGNQSVVDCRVDGVATQVKTANMKKGKAEVTHQVKGRNHRPYHANDPIEQVVVGGVVKSGDDFWLVYAVVPKTKLVEARIFESDAHPAAHPCLTLPLGSDLGAWLAGKHKYRSGKDDWRCSALYGWRPPVKLEPTERLSLELLEEAAQKAGKPDKAPGEQRLAWMIARYTNALARKVAADADRAERAAERVEAAASAGPSTVINNNITNNDYSQHLHLHGKAPAKRLRDGSLKDFFLKQ